jgi:PadR family transcriptional regulator, regulatory protein PadR
MAKHLNEQRLEFLQGTLDMLILRTLQWGRNDLLKVETGSLYPALHRLVKHGWLKAEWGVSEARPPHGPQCWPPARRAWTW